MKGSWMILKWVQWIKKSKNDIWNGLYLIILTIGLIHWNNDLSIIGFLDWRTSTKRWRRRVCLFSRSVWHNIKYRQKWNIYRQYNQTLWGTTIFNNETKMKWSAKEIEKYANIISSIWILYCTVLYYCLVVVLFQYYHSGLISIYSIVLFLFRKKCWSCFNSITVVLLQYYCHSCLVSMDR